MQQTGQWPWVEPLPNGACKLIQPLCVFGQEAWKTLTPWLNKNPGRWLNLEHCMEGRGGGVKMPHALPNMYNVASKYKVRLVASSLLCQKHVHIWKMAAWRYTVELLSCKWWHAASRYRSVTDWSDFTLFQALECACVLQYPALALLQTAATHQSRK